MNSTESKEPPASVALAPLALYLQWYETSNTETSIGSVLPERHAVIALLECHLNVKRKSHGFGSHVKHALDFFICSMVFQTDHENCLGFNSGKELVKCSLPEANFGSGLPEIIGLNLVTCLQELVVQNEQRVGRNIVWERRIGSRAWHLV